MLSTERERNTKALETIIGEVCRQIGIEWRDLGSRSRRATVVLSRELIAHLSRSLTTASYPMIAEAMDLPTHSTVIAAFDRMTVKLACPIPDQFTVQMGGETITLAALYSHIQRRVLLAMGSRSQGVASSPNQ